MNWQDNTMRLVDDAKEMNSTHLHDDTTPHTTNDTRLSSKKNVTQSSSNNSEAKKHATKTKIHLLSPILHLNKKGKMLYVPLQFEKYENQALLNTGASQSAISEAELRKSSQLNLKPSFKSYPRLISSFK